MPFSLYVFSFLSVFTFQPPLGLDFQNEKERKQIAENGYNYIKQFTWDRTVIQLEKIFKNEFKGAKHEKHNLSRWIREQA